ncbi:MAG: hypothetical protein M1838_002838 [Thelocarpon superellum]|nr:MAG: hypothetical protein M1838_002838 [Thelocarpon superellum]
MKLSGAVVFSALLALVAARAAPQDSAADTATATFSGTPAQISQAGCLASCNPTDNTCRSACLVGPAANPNDVPANQTTDCAKQCVQGDGSSADNVAYGNCLSACISSFFSFTSLPTTETTASTGAPGATTTGAGTTTTGSGSSSGTASSTGTASNTGTITSSATSTGTATSTSTATAATTTSKSGAGAVNVGGSVAGAVGIVAAILAL